MPAIYRVHEQPDPPRVERLIEQLARSTCRRRRCPSGLSARSEAGELAAEASRLVAARPPGAGTAARRIHRSCSAPSNRPTTATATSATPASAALPTATSPRRSAATRTWSSTGRCSRRWARGRRRRAPARCARSPLHCSERERESTRIERDADDVCAAFLLERELLRAAAGDELRGRGLGGDRRRAPSSPSAASSATSTRASCRRGGCAASDFELNETETALVGSDSGRSGAARRPGRGHGSPGSSAPAGGSTWSRPRAGGRRWQEGEEEARAGLRRRRHQPPRRPQVRAGREDGGRDRAARLRGEVAARRQGADERRLRGRRAGRGLAAQPPHPAL